MVTQANPMMDTIINFVLYLHRKRPRGVMMKRATKKVTVDRVLR